MNNCLTALKRARIISEAPSDGKVMMFVDRQLAEALRYAPEHGEIHITLRNGRIERQIQILSSVLLQPATK